MSKQTSRQTSKQGQSTNKQSNNQNLKPASSAKKQTASGSVKPSTSATKPQTRQAMKQERREEERRRQLIAKQRAARNKRILIGSLIVAAVALIAATTIFIYNANAKNPTSQKQATPTQQVVNAAYPPVDGIYCNQSEQLAYHIHVHLTIWINGVKVPVPQGIGIASDSSCLYWLHTHDNSGVIHIESPNAAPLNLQNFLDIWRQVFQTNGYHDELALPADWTIYVNGKPISGGFNKVVFQPHMVITLAYNSPNITPETSYPWPQGE